MQRFDGHPDIAHTLAHQAGLITRRQALDTGMSDALVDGLVRTGRWVPVRRGVYMQADAWESLDAYDGRPRARARAAHLTMRAAHVLSHESAARELGLAILTPDEEIIHVTRRGVRGGRLEHGVKHHLAPYQRDQVLEVEGVPVLDAARTAADIAREHGYVHGTIACDAARQLGVRLGALWSAVEPMTCWPEVTVVRACIQDSDAGAESVGETLGRILLHELGLGPIQTQFELRDETGWARCDMRVGRQLFEFDGHKKYLRRDRGGLAVVDAEEVVWREKQREDWLRGYRLGMSRLVWADYWGERRARAKERILREYAATCAAYGTDVSDLAHVIVRRSA
jgi:hypothetical protein